MQTSNLLRLEGFLADQSASVRLTKEKRCQHPSMRTLLRLLASRALFATSSLPVACICSRNTRLNLSNHPRYNMQGDCESILRRSLLLLTTLGRVRLIVFLPYQYILG